MHPSSDPLRSMRLVPLEVAQATASELNLAGVAGVPDPQQLAQSSPSAPPVSVHLPDSSQPVRQLPALQPFVPAPPALAAPENFEADPLYGDLLSNLHREMLAPLTQVSIADKDVPGLSVVGEDTALHALSPELNLPSGAEPWIPDRPGDVAADAPALLQDYQQSVSAAYPSAWMDQAQADAWRARHVNLLDQGWE
ncbi:hypothetical protein [Dictyobacter arantiisoli]|uniref:Uncharacterized protein n=1 Tax=Dictyobacter arantiisoli TaxID=2014874 RepID=A0A5A5TJ17_9CHLR|nr:hypothetical protein [Dictyobacter arantiisoli]GCF11208.1 hypothetical protein KDI_47720 [Dictyobacter arantiisoli]